MLIKAKNKFSQKIILVSENADCQPDSDAQSYNKFYSGKHYRKKKYLHSFLVLPSPVFGQKSLHPTVCTPEH